MRKLLGILAVGLVCLASVGCGTIFSPEYWGRHVEKFSESAHEFRLDIDQVIFDLEERPIEEQH